MGNSFYYFFSSIPQVLSGVIALFGVFVIFKIQAIKFEMAEIVKETFSSFMMSFSYTLPSEPIAVRNQIEEAFKNDNLEKLKSIFKKLGDEYIDPFYIKYSNKAKFIKRLIRDTIITSIFTSIVIAGCLSIIPLDDWLYKHPVLLYGIYLLVTICLFVILLQFVFILITSLQESGK